ncbi:type III-A CRISPR-associated protein Cas10/Csm1, partial [bacterium]|nr:type III-A CRISPR-associated protein Cas10/Csm1 [bacterium]
LIWGLNLIFKRFENKNLACYSDDFEPKELLETLSWKNVLQKNSDQKLLNIFTQLHCGEKTLGVTEKFLASEKPNDFARLESLSGNESETYLLNLLENFGSDLPFFETETAVSVFDAVKILVALSESKEKNYTIFKGDFSGIQDFVYTADSENALKIIRARSVYLELLSKSLTLDVCEKLGISSACILSSGGGNFQILIPQEKVEEELFKGFYQKVNSFFINNFGGKIHFVVGSVKISLEDLKGESFSEKEKALANSLENCKKTRYKSLASEVFKKWETKGVCKTCGTEVTDKDFKDNDVSDASRCGFCKSFKAFGEVLAHEVKKICGENKDGKWVYAFEKSQAKIELPSLLEKGKERSFKVNPKNVTINPENVTKSNQLILGDYSFKKGRGNADFEDLANESVGSDVLGLLVMDVDNMGLLLVDGMKTAKTGLERLIFNQSISRRLDLFFKTKVNEILKKPTENENYQPFSKLGSNSEERHAAIIYSGGDDLVLVGAWNEVLEIAFEVESEFRKFIGNNLDLGISAGFSIVPQKYPFYLAVKEAQESEKAAKKNSLSEKNFHFRSGEFGNNTWETLLQNYETGKKLFVKTNKEGEKSLSIKNSFCFFYDESLNCKEFEGKVRLSVSWQEAKEKIFPIISGLLENAKLEDNKVNLGVSRALISKLFASVDKFRNSEVNDISYQINLIYHIAREKENREMLVKNLIENGVWKDENFMFYLPFALHYLELIIREKGEK